MLMNFPKMIKQARRKMKISQAQLAKQLGYSSTAVSLWEKGTREAPYRVLAYCMDKLDMNMYQVCNKCDGTGLIRRISRTMNNNYGNPR